LIFVHHRLRLFDLCSCCYLTKAGLVPIFKIKFNQYNQMVTDFVNFSSNVTRQELSCQARKFLSCENRNSAKVLVFYARENRTIGDFKLPASAREAFSRGSLSYDQNLLKAV